MFQCFYNKSTFLQISRSLAIAEKHAVTLQKIVSRMRSLHDEILDKVESASGVHANVLRSLYDPLKWQLETCFENEAKKVQAAA